MSNMFIDTYNSKLLIIIGLEILAIWLEKY